MENTCITEQFVIVSKDRFNELRARERAVSKKEVARRHARYIAVCQWLSLAALIAGVIFGVIAVSFIMYTGAQAGKNWDGCIVHAAMEMFMCITPGILACYSSFNMD